MSGILAWFARNGVAANLLMWSVVAGGIASLSGVTHTQLMPNIDYELITVRVPYPGASPEEVDETVCVRIAEKLRGVKTVRRVYTVATEDLCHARAQLVRGTAVREALSDVKAQIDTIDTFPAGVDKPIVQEFDPPDLALGLVISGQADEQTLVRLGERMREEVAALPGVSLATLTGIRPYEVSVEVSEETLRRYGLTFSNVADAVRRSSLDLPGGSIKTRSSGFLLRAQGQAYFRESFERLPLLNGRDGVLTLKDVASISDGFAETVNSLRFDGKPAVLIEVYRVGNEDYRNVAWQIRDYVAKAQDFLPEGLTVSIWSDVTVFLRGRLATMLRSGRDGLLLVLLVLALFLRLRLAIWVALGIPVALLGALWWMPWFDQSINIVSLVGFIVVLGILVDDAIVVSENVYRYHQKGLRGAEAAVAGVSEVAAPVVFSTLTTVAAFLPMAGLAGPVGQPLAAIPVVVILCLGFSLVESLFVLPAHLRHLPEPTATPRPFSWGRVQHLLDLLLDRLETRVYGPALKRALAWRGATLAVALALLLVSLGVVAGGRLRFFFFLPMEADVITVGLTLPQGTPVEVTSEVLDRVERSVEELRSRLADELQADVIRHVLTQVGSLPGSGIQFADPGRLAESGSHLGGVTLELAPSEERIVSTLEIGRRLRELVGSIPDAVELSYSTSLLAAGRAIDLELTGTDLEELQVAAAELKTALAQYPGVHGISDTLRIGKPLMRITVTPEAEALGIGLAELSRQVRQAFYGEEAQRFQRGRHELKVMVRYPESQRRFLATLEEMRIRTARGDEVPFAVAGRIERGRSFAAIERTNGRWTIRVGADVDPGQANSGEIAAALRGSVLPQLTATHPGLSYSFAGEQQEQHDVVGLLLRHTILAFLAIYGLLALACRSFLQPVVLMGAIPFGLIGAICGHLVMGFPLTIWSLVGLVALSGVVVNDGLILTKFIQRAHRVGLPLTDAIWRSGKARLRPVLLTALTTFVGLAPLVFGKSLQSRFLIPLGIALGFGVVFSSLVSLLVVPVGYSLLSDLMPLSQRASRESSVESLQSYLTGGTVTSIEEDID